MFTCGLVRSNFSLAIALLVIYLINNQHLHPFMSCYRDLNPGPLPYQGSALPLSYNSKKKESGRRGSNPRPSAWKANALSTELLPRLPKLTLCLLVCGQRWIRTTEVERQQIYSLPHLATLVFALN